VLESARIAGRITDREYLAGMDRLSAQATRLAELAVRTQTPGAGAPRVELVLRLESDGIDSPAALPDGVEPARRASGGGDLIEVG
jgi:hypothetical protein